MTCALIVVGVGYGYAVEWGGLKSFFLATLGTCGYRLGVRFSTPGRGVPLLGVIQDGGGLYIYEGCTATLNGCSIYSNAANVRVARRPPPLLRAACPRRRCLLATVRGYPPCGYGLLRYILFYALCRIVRGLLRPNRGSVASRVERGAREVRLSAVCASAVSRACFAPLVRMCPLHHRSCSAQLACYLACSGGSVEDALLFKALM